jgi:hypothetical protein
MSAGQAFEFTPGGIQPLAAPSLTGPSPAVIPAGQAIATLRQQVAEQEAAREAPKATPIRASVAPAALTGRALIKNIRARLREVSAELKRLDRLRREQAELKRLLAAAKQPPASVASIHSARKSG